MRYFNQYGRLAPMMNAAGDPGAGNGGTPPAGGNPNPNEPNGGGANNNPPGTPNPNDPPQGGDPNAGGNGGNNGTPPQGGKTFTQAELDDILTKRLAREKKAWEDKIEEEKRKAAMTEAERLKAEKEEAEKRAQAIQAGANQRLVEAEAKVLASSLGVKPERMAYLLKLADMSEVAVDDKGVDTNAVKVAIEKVLTDMPELKGQVQNPTPVGGGSNPAGGGNPGVKIYTKAELATMSPADINKNWETIQEQMAKGLIK